MLRRTNQSNPASAISNASSRACGISPSHYGDRLGADVVLSRVFINWGVQPWFGAGVWNLDRIFLHGNQLWHLEIKHKYPMEREARLHFGINDGELRQIASLLECGLRSLHVVTVKPFWERQSGSMYLLNDLEARSRAAILSMETDRGQDIPRVSRPRRNFGRAHFILGSLQRSVPLLRSHRIPVGRRPRRYRHKHRLRHRFPNGRRARSPSMYRRRDPSLANGRTYDHSIGARYVTN